jgi:CoA:oxalate CoA-transferase
VTPATGALPLDGLLVVDLGQVYNGPYAGLLLALAGAQVIKVEPPGGELLRKRAERIPGQRYPFATLNANKQGVTLNLKTDRGRALLLDLAAHADVLIENFRPGVLDRLGVGWQALRERQPRLIFASSSGYGSTGPRRDHPAMDITVQAASGVMSITGWPDRPPVKAGPAIADFLGGIHLYAAILTALLEREHSGCGHRVEVAMQDAVIPSLASSLGLYFGSNGHEIPMRTGNRHNGLAEAPYNTYRATDGDLALIGATDAHWQAITRVIGQGQLATDPRFQTASARVANIDEVDEVISKYAVTRARDELCDELLAAGVPCAPVSDLGEVMSDPHLHQRGTLQPLQHPDFGQITAFSSPLRFDDQPPAQLRPSPGLGEHNQQVYAQLIGLDSQEIDQLEQDGVI